MKATTTRKIDVYFSTQAVRLRGCNSTAFASLKKFALHFFNANFVATEPNEVLYETIDGKC